MIYLAVLNFLFILVLLYFTKIILDHKYSHRTFTRLIEHINVGYYRYRVRDGVLLSANRAFIDILELEMQPKDVRGRSLSELMIYIEGEGSIREKVKEWGELRNHEYHFKTLDGKDKWVLHNSYIVRDRLTGEEVIEALIEDITEERMSYERMKISQERYEKLFRSSGDMVIIYRFDDLTIEEVNPVTEVISGYGEEELTGRSFDSIIHPASRRDFLGMQKDLIFRGASRLDTVIVTRNGQYKQVILTLSVVEIQEEKIVMAVVKDVSELMREREEQARRKKELEDFWRSSVEREERIKDLRSELERTKQQLKMLKEKYGS